MAFGYRAATADEILAEQALIVPAVELLPDQRAFLNAYARTHGVVAAAKACKIHKFYHWQWCKEDGQYQAAFEAIRAIVEAEDAEGIKKRAAKGWAEPLHYRGIKTGHTVRRYSDALSLGYMKAVDPKWRDGTQIAVGPAKIEISITQKQPDSTEQNAIIVNTSG
jgi:hypothetical protein